MVTRVTGFVAKVIAVVFTSVMAPLLVNLTVRDLLREEAKPAPAERRPCPKEDSPRPATRSVPSLPPAPAAEPAPRPRCQPAPAPAPAPVPPPVEVTQIIVQGVGWTPGEAFQDGLRSAIREALAAQVDAATWARNGQAIFEVVMRSSGGVILSWKELKASKEWRLRGTLHHKEVAVELNRRALVDHLKTARIVDQTSSPVVWRPAGAMARAPSLPIP